MLAIRGIAQARSELQGPAAATAKILANIKEDRFAQAWSTVINELFLKTDGNARQVIDSITFAFELQRNNPYLRFFQGLAYLQLGERDAGYEAVSQVVSARPLWQLPRVRLSRMKLEAGQKQAAFEDASEAFAINRTIAAGSNLAIIAAARIDPSNLKANTELLEFVANIQNQVPGEESTLPLYVQLLVRTNQVEQAKAVINNALSSKKQPAVGTFLRLASVSRAAKLELEEACLAAAEKSGLTPDLAVARATAMAEAGNPAGAVKYLQDCIQKIGAADLSWRLALANFLEQIKDDRAAATWIALGDDSALKTNLIVQHQALAAASAQKDSVFISRTIERIRAVSGDKSIGWKLAQARLLLRDQANAANPALMKILGEIISAAPNNLDVRALLAAAHEKSKNIPAAIEQLIAARKLQPTSKGLNLELARLYTAQLDFERAREILESIQPESLEPAQGRVAARLSGQQGDIKRAIGFAEAAQAGAPALDRLYLAELYRRSRQDTKAEAIYKSLLEKPDRLEVIMAAADYYASRGEKGPAIQTLANLDKLSLRPAEKDFAMAEYSLRHGDANQALAHYLAVVETAPTIPDGWRALVSEYIRLGKADQAVEAARKAVRALPADPGKPFQNVIDSASALAALASEKMLVPLMVALMEPSPDGEAAAKALPIIVDAIKTKASPQTVTKSLRSIADGAPRLPALQMLLVQNYILGGKPEEAAAIALRSQRISPASPEIARNTAVALLATGKLAEALPHAQQWRQLTPENPLSADLFIAQLQLGLEDYVSALRLLQPYMDEAKANPKDQNLALVLAIRAQALIKRGDDTAAADLIGPFLADQPQMRAIWRDLTQLLPNPLADKWITRLAVATPPDDVNENIQRLSSIWPPSLRTIPSSCRAGRFSRKLIIAKARPSEDIAGHWSWIPTWRIRSTTWR